MNPLLTFTAGILAGVAAVRWLKDEKTRSSLDAAEARARDVADQTGAAVRGRLDQVQESLRGAALSGLTAVEQSSARLRAKLTPAPESPGETGPATASTTESAPKRARKTTAARTATTTPKAKAGTRSPRKKAATPSAGGAQS